jgi:threonine dehydratase
LETAAGRRAVFAPPRLVAEGAGATATAALLAGRVKLPRGARVAAIVSGGNVDPDRFVALYAGQGVAG